MVGILVHGNNHFILSGPSPDEATALALVRRWSIIQIGEAKSLSFDQWEIKSKEFRENLEWAVIVPGEREVSPGVAQLLAELSARGVIIQRFPTGCC
jgi:hypothetical protein